MEDHSLTTQALYEIHVASGEPGEILSVTVPHQIVAATTLVGHHLWLDSQTVQDLDRRLGDLYPLDAQFFEHGIVIR